MSEQQDLAKEPHRDGPPWHILRVFSSFDEADTFRKSVVTSSKQIKVKKQLNTTGHEVFVVKSRNNLTPSPEVEDVPVKKNKKSKSKD